MDRTDIESVYPLSPMQQGMLFECRNAPDAALYVEQIRVELRGVDAGLLRRAWSHVARSCPALRTSILARGVAEPVQVVRRAVDLPWSEHPVAELEAYLERDAAAGLALDGPCLHRLAYFAAGPRDGELVWTLHHVALDGWSGSLVLDDVFAAYGALQRGEEPAATGRRPFRDYIAWLRERRPDRSEPYWREALAGVEDTTELAGWRGSDADPVVDYARAAHRFSREATEALRRGAADARVTLGTLLQAAWALTLARSSGTRDVVFGNVVSGRPEALEGVDRMVGMFVNTLPTRVRIPECGDVGELLRALQASEAAQREHSDSALWEVRRWSELPAGAPLFRSLLVVENYRATLETGVPGLEVAVTPPFDRTGVPLLLLVVPGDELELQVVHDARGFDGRDVERLLAMLASAAVALASDPSASPAALLRPSEVERAGALAAARGAPPRGRVEATVHAAFRRRAHEAPDAEALVCAGESWTYGELAARAGRIASALAERGAGPGARVALGLGRTADSVAALLGVLEVGAAYVPLDPAHPVERLAFLLEDAAPAALVVDAATRERIAAVAPGGAPILDLDADAEELANAPVHEPVATAELAYVLYTSGSTGWPKGVAMPHAPLANLLAWQVERSGEAAARTLHFAPTSFDVSFQEIFSTLSAGATLVVASEDERLDPAALLERMERERVTRAFLPPVALRELCRAAGERDTLALELREVLVAGEELVLGEEHRAFFGRLPGCALENQYGPTEAHVVSAWRSEGPPRDWPARPPIGRPIEGVNLYVVDERLELVPPGASGELCIGGAAPAAGYPSDAARTAARFVRDPFADGPDARMYRTGDRVRLDVDGALVFLGRLDAQAKVRGFRVEPGEVESVLLEQAGVRHAAAVVRDDGPDRRRLVAYVSLEPGAETTSSELRDALARRLPAGTLPSAVAVLDELPTTRSGKLDRRALAGPDHAPLLERREPVAPRDPREAAIAEIWREVLGVAELSVLDDFFALGGHSLFATQVVARLRSALAVELPVRAIFDHPTVAALAARVREARGSGESDAPIPRLARDGGPLELSFAQRRLWFVDQMGAGAAYNMPWAFELAGALDADRLEAAIAAVVARHEPLRTRYPALDGRPAQVIDPHGAVALARVDLTGVDAGTRRARLDAIAREEADLPFDLAQGPVLRPRLVRLSADEHVLFLSVHHIAFDGWSIHVVARELFEHYRAAADGDEPVLPALPVQYVDYAAWQAGRLQGSELERQRSYWLEQLGGLTDLDLPTDRPRPATRGNRGGTVPLELPEELVRKLRALARREGVTLAMVLLAGFQALLARLTGRTDLAVGAPIANRTRREIEDLIGFFVNSLVLRADLAGEPSFREVLSRVQRMSLDAYDNQDYPFEQLVDELRPERNASRNPLFQVVFAMLNAPEGALRLPGLRVEPYETEGRRTRFDLELHLVDLPEGLRGGFCYDVALFDVETVERFARHYVTLLAAAAADPKLRLSELPLLTGDERQQLLAVDAGRAVAPAEPACLHELFARVAERRGSATALSWEGRSVAYAELLTRARRLGRHLRELGVGPETLVGLFLERGPDLVVGVLGILEAGGAYVPIDPATPAERVAFVLDDTDVAAIVTDEGRLEQLGARADRAVCLDRDAAAIAARSDAPVDAGARPDSAAYVIYTSGSTGTPKGVVVEHRHVVRLFSSTRSWFPFDETDVWTLFHSISFDFSVWELWGALLHGGRLVVVPYWKSRAPDEFLTLCADEGVTVLNQTPSAFRTFSAADEQRGGRDALALRYVVFGGEALELSSLAPWIERRGDAAPQLINMYGITETTVHVTYRRILAADVAAARGSVIGRPIPDLRLYVLDEHLEPVPRGVRGELYVGGAGVSRGYLRRDELTARRFLPDPFSSEPGARLYRTGDVGRRLADGDVEYLERNDEQVKLRGFRIELGEIEAALREQPRVREAVAALRQNADGDRRIVAYVVPDPEARSAEAAEVVEHWSALYDDTYGGDAAEREATFDIVGWNSSYTGGAIPAEEMREWLDEAVERVLRDAPRRVLEIGCGTGLLLHRIAPHCEHYRACDFSREAVEGVARALDPALRDRVALDVRAANDFTGVEPAAFDVVVINSVVQYFPSVGYLLDVLEGAVAATAPGGRVVVGDVRDLRLLEAFHRAIELRRNGGEAGGAELEGRVRRRVAQEEELVLDPDLFLSLVERFPRVRHVEVEPKRGVARNELTEFRYEVTLWVDGAPALLEDGEVEEWGDRSGGVDELLERLERAGTERVGLRGIPNARVLEACGDPRRGVDPGVLWKRATDGSWSVRLGRARADADGAFEAVLARDGAETRVLPLPAIAPRPTDERANHPLRAKMTREMAPRLRKALGARLPEYMVPSAFVVLDSLPLTPNGKVDREALPEPDTFSTPRPSVHVAPRTPTEERLAAIWSELLGVDPVGAEDDFFDLGGHSLLATQVLSRVRDEMEVDLDLRVLFDAPKLAQLAESIDGLAWLREGAAVASAPDDDRERGEL